MIGIGSLGEINDLSHSPIGAALAWLGQAGFLVAIASQRIVIDPYLSDSLAEKYKGTAFPHTRMMPTPVAPDALQDIDWVICTHAHTDHMDPGSLPGILESNPGCRVLVPRAAAETAVERGVPVDRLVMIDAGETLDLGGINVTATVSAHEEIERDDNGCFRFLGYILSGGGVRIWHSGDTIPFPGLVEQVIPASVDLALLPINGRDARRAKNGVPGNLTVDEALDLTDAIGADGLLCHHYGMFDFNTEDPVNAHLSISSHSTRADCQLAQLNTRFEISPRPASKPTRLLAVCRGNICRSPLAEAILQTILDPDVYKIDSAAIEDWNVGRPPDERSILVASELGLDISGQSARQIVIEDFDNFDIIFGMDAENMAALARLRPAHSRARLAHFGAYTEAGQVADIIDPYEYGLNQFRSVAEIIQTAALGLRRWMQE